ncbi:hypothetical protein [Methanomethylovorans sp.]|uniref:hypothetical protein n=1 Tax=Methanomethylovorans sp. TaxID=2758717 RepID=UPI00345EFD81
MLLTSVGKNDSQFSWQPRGNKIAFLSDRNGFSNIWVMNSDGTEKMQLTNSKEKEMDIKWSPDGTKIAYASASVLNTSNISTLYNVSKSIWVMNSDGSNRKRLDFSYDRLDSHPTWSSDGKKIIFDSMYKRESSHKIILMDVNGTNKTVLAEGWWPQWSPKGDKIAFISSEGEKSTISLIILDEELRSAPSKNVEYISDISQESVKNTPGFGAALTALILLSRKSLRKKSK